MEKEPATYLSPGIIFHIQLSMASLEWKPDEVSDIITYLYLIDYWIPVSGDVIGLLWQLSVIM